MDEKNKRMRLGFALIVVVLVAFSALPSMGDQKVNLFNPFSLQSKSVVIADSAPSVLLDDFLLITEASSGKLGDGDPRPTIALRGQEIRIPQRPNLRSAFSKVPYAASLW